MIARESAYFLLAFVNIGLVPDGGSSLFVPERVGLARAAEMAMLGERVPARQALEWGLINRVVGRRRLRRGGRRARRAPRRRPDALLRAAPSGSSTRGCFGRLDAQLELEAALQQEAAASADFLEGVQAFLEKAPARVRGPVGR